MAGVQGKTAVVTGASSGIGREVALQLAGRGYRVALIARRQEALQTVAKRIVEEREPIVKAIDLCDAPTIEPAFRELLNEIGRVDVMVSAAGQGLLQPFLSHSEQDVQRSMQLHYFAPAALIRMALPGMIDAGQGHIINVASVASKVGPWGHSAYAAAKAALTTLTRTLETEYKETGVYFSVVHPGIVDTPFFEHPSYVNMAEHVRKHAVPPNIVAQRIVRLLDRPRREVFVPSHYRVIEYLKLYMPGLVHGRIANQSRPRKQKGTQAEQPATVQT